VRREWVGVARRVWNSGQTWALVFGGSTSRELLLPARMENDNYVRPLDLSRVLKSAGMIVVGPAMTVRDAEKLARDNEQMLMCWMFGSKSRIASRLLAIFGKRHPLPLSDQ